MELDGLQDKTLLQVRHGETLALLRWKLSLNIVQFDIFWLSRSSWTVRCNLRSGLERLQKLSETYRENFKGSTWVEWFTWKHRFPCFGLQDVDKLLVSCNLRKHVTQGTGFASWNLTGFLNILCLLESLIEASYPVRIIFVYICHVIILDLQPTSTVCLDEHNEANFQTLCWGFNEPLPRAPLWLVRQSGTQYDLEEGQLSSGKNKESG